MLSRFRACGRGRSQGCIGVAAGALIALLGFCGSLTADDVDCLPGTLVVETQLPGSEGMVCEGARRAVKLLATCGLQVRRPLHLSIVDKLPVLPRADELGYFNRRTSQAVVLEFERCRQIVAAAGRFGVPMTPNLYQSLVSHELAHAVVAQQENAVVLRRVAHEYVAYVIQMQSMDAATRDSIMSRYPHDTPIAIEELSELYLDLSPPDFAVKAYLHFSADVNGCRFLKQLVNGVTVLPSGL